MANRYVFEDRLTATGRTSVANRLLIRDFGNSIYLDGTTGYLEYTPASGIPLQPSEQFSLSFWAKIPTLGNATILFAQANSANAFGPDFRIRVNTSGKLSIYLRNDANSVERDTLNETACIKLNQWQHFLYTQSVGGTTVTGKIYVDGIDVTGSGTWTFGYTGVHTFNTFTFGAVHRSTVLLYQPMFLDEVALIKGRALTLAEVQNIYYRGIYPLDSKTIYTKFDENTGTTSSDSSGNGNTATLTGAGARWSTDVVMNTDTRSSV